MQHSVDWKRYFEGAALRLFGPRGLGMASGLVWATSSFRARGNPTVLAITHTLFEKDIAEIDRSRAINWLFLPKRKFGRTQKRFLPQESRRQRFYYASMSESAMQPAWRDLERFATGMLDVLTLRHRIDAVFSAHVDYWQDEGIRRACVRRGIPFLVLCQENYNIPKTYRTRQSEFESIKFRFGGTAIATFSSHMRDLFVNGGICDANRVVVTGAPRFDGWQRCENRPTKRIVLLAFLDSKKYYSSKDYFFPVLDALTASAAQAGWELVVKCKAGGDLKAVRQHLGERSDVTVTAETPLPELLSSASIIVGANSLSMAESLLSGAELIVPSFDAETVDPDTQMFDAADAEVSRHIRFAKSVDELTASVSASIQSAPAAIDRAGRLALLQRYVHYTDGQPSAQRVVDFIMAFAKGRDRRGEVARVAGSAPVATRSTSSVNEG